MRGTGGATLHSLFILRSRVSAWSRHQDGVHRRGPPFPRHRLEQATGTVETHDLAREVRERIG